MAPLLARGFSGRKDGDSTDHDLGIDENFSTHWLQNQCLSLESLPAELRDQIMSNAPDLPTLHSLILASPVMHAQYLSNRNNLLRACVNRELDGFFVDAYACVMSRVCEIGSPRTDEKVTAFLDSYRGWLSGLLPDAPSASKVRWLAAFHRCVVRPLALQYSTWALGNLRNGTLSSGAKAVASIGLTRSEEIRIFRALYRYHTYQHLFGRNKGKRRGWFRHHQVLELFFCLFDPWEAEAIGCIELFLRQIYENIFNDIKADLRYENPRFWTETGTFNGGKWFDLDAEHDKYMEGTLSRGLRIAVRLFAIKDHAALVNKMQSCLTPKGLDAPMRTALGSVAQDLRRALSTNPPTAGDEAERRRDPVTFVSDTVPPDGPPLVWVLLWGGKYANLYGEYVPESLRQWGYIMWDEWRWTDLGAKDLVAKQWETAPELVEGIKTDFNWSPVES